MTRREDARQGWPNATRVAVVSVAIAAAVVALFASTACSAARWVPSEPAGITGTVTTVVAGDGRPASFLVEGATPQPTGAVSDKANVNIPTSTQFFEANGKPASLDSIGAIATGTRVKVWFAGAIAESYPVQGSARAVQIIGDAK